MSFHYNFNDSSTCTILSIHGGLPPSQSLSGSVSEMISGEPGSLGGTMAFHLPHFLHLQSPASISRSETMTRGERRGVGMGVSSNTPAMPVRSVRPVRENSYSGTGVNKCPGGIGETALETCAGVDDSKADSPTGIMRTAVESCVLVVAVVGVDKMVSTGDKVISTVYSVDQRQLSNEVRDHLQWNRDRLDGA